jgi:hypothetical protein
MTLTEHPVTDRPSSSSGPSGPDPEVLDPERHDILEALTTHRAFLRQTVEGVADADAARRTTVSDLTLGGIVKHVTQTEAQWTAFIEKGPTAFPAWDDPSAFQDRLDNFTMLPGDTVESVLAAYEAVARHTDALLAGLGSLDDSRPLPDAPWFEHGATRSARRVFVHIVAETAQHAGHADIVREALYGSRTMG